jgi:hypothetical protein
MTSVLTTYEHINPKKLKFEISKQWLTCALKEGQQTREFRFATPPMACFYPKMTETAVLDSLAKFNRDQTGARFECSVTATENETHAHFFEWLDKLDQQLLDFIMANQAWAGRENETRDRMMMLLKPTTKKNVNQTTGQFWPARFSTHKKAIFDSEWRVLPCYGPQNEPIDAGTIQHNDIISMHIKLSGGYKHQGTFALRFELVSVKLIEKASNFMDTVEANFAFPEFSQA